jgi:hypothetical protein
LGSVYHGNIWLDSLRYVSGYGAVNLNTITPQALLNSLFTTNSTINYHNPLIPTDSTLGPFFVNDQGWFNFLPAGNSFDCLQSQTCNSALAGGDEGEMFRQLVINDSAVSTVFIEESKEIAKQLVYEDLVNDSVFDNNDYLQFVAANENSTIGKLYSINEQLASIFTSDSTTLSNIDSLQDQLSVWTDSLHSIDLALSIQQDSILDSLKSIIVEQIEFQRNEVCVLLNQHLANVNNGQSLALQENNTISPTIAPQLNEQYINDVYVRFKSQGRNILVQEYNGLLSVAQQCPSSGGEAVFRARELVRQVNDSVEYDDASVCAQMGIYRKKQVTTDQNHAINFLLIPNPAKEQVQLVSSGFLPYNELKITIHDLAGRILIEKLVRTKLISVVLNTTTLTNGIYVVEVTTDQQEKSSTKLVINK